MESMEWCPVCKTQGVITDEENGQKVHVCTECGAMDDDMVDLADDKSSEGTTRVYGDTMGPDALWHRAFLQKDCRGLIEGRKVIKMLGPSFHFSKDMIEDAIKLFEKVYEGDIKGVKEDRRRAMCVACLYVVAKVNNKGIHIRNVGTYLDIPHAYKKFSSALNILKNKYDVKLPEKNVMNEVFDILSEKSFSSGEIRLVQQLIPLFDRSWISSGRTATTTFYAASYFAWIAKDYYTRRKTSYQQFCKKFGIPAHRDRKKEIHTMLQAMTKELPWVTNGPDEVIDVAFHLNDVIKYQNLLFDSALKTAIQNMKLEQELNNDDTDLEKRKTDDIDQMEKHETVFKREVNSRKAKMDEDYENDILNAIESLPKRQKLNPEDQNDKKFFNEELGSDDDEDISQYIRTPNEVQAIEAMYERNK